MPSRRRKSVAVRPVAGLLIAVVFTGGCAAGPAGLSLARGESFRSVVEHSHGYGPFYEHEALAYDLHVYFGGEDRLVGRVIAENELGRVRMDFDDGTTLLWDGERAWVSPADADFSGARFDLLTWPYFLNVAFKLADPGANLAEMPPTDRFGRAKLTFGEGVGDAPDDWYMIFADQQTGLIDHMSYIVTYSSSQDEAEQSPSAIRYDRYAQIDDVWLSTDWSFWKWSEQTGIKPGTQKGWVKLRNLAFVEPAPGTFDRPADSRESKLPG